MHAGEAICLLQALVTHFERQGSRDPGLLAITGKGQEACKVLADHIKVPLPEGEQRYTWQQYLSSLQDAARPKPSVADCFKGPGDAAPPRTYTSPPAGRQKSVSGDVTLAISTANELLDKLDEIEDRPDLNENGQDFVNSCREKAKSVLDQAESKNFVTEKQISMLNNMLSGADRWMR